MIFNRDNLLSEDAINSIMDVIEKQEKRIIELEKSIASILGRSIEKEIDFLKSENLTTRKIASRYNKNNDKKNGFSTSEIYQHFGGAGNPTEIKMAEFIYSKIQ